MLEVNNSKSKELSELAEAHHFVDEYTILGFFKDFRFLSNFHMCKVVVDGIEFPSSEHAYMAEKTIYREEKEIIAKIEKATDVKKYGSSMTISKEFWDEYRLIAMTKVLMAKFTQNEDLKEQLLATGDKLLVETNWWNDRFWGEDINGNGKSMLGECLMAVRSLLNTNTSGA